ncbi:hypothetical protein [Polyangium aurulentum]|uniref:hypothetical protein n=1 Tax=Polyangium aurulentum TaxID=2567896 RepID=UPI00146B6929|nr:hypothetical protein [Polyangium aurulentum]UQA61360.1 hypothetical protein E8A73_013150 [Polyangium aurulentum]
MPPWRLTYVRDAGAPANCPDEKYVRLSVGAYLGYDPFTDDAPRSISVKVVLAPQRLEAHIEARDESGRIVDTQTAWAPTWRCDMLIDRAAVFLREIVDPLVIPSAEKPAPPAEASEAPPPIPMPDPPAAPPITSQQPARPTPAAPTRSPWIPKLTVSLDAGPTWWAAPVTGMSLTMGVAARWPRFSLGFEGRYDIAWSLPTRKDVQVSLTAGTILACAYKDVSRGRAFMRGCMFGGLGGLSSDAERIAFDREAAVIDIGVRVGGGYWLFGPVGIELHADGAYVAYWPVIRIDDAVVWRMKPVTGALRLGLVGLLDVL